MESIFEIWNTSNNSKLSFFLWQCTIHFTFECSHAVKCVQLLQIKKLSLYITSWNIWFILICSKFLTTDLCVGRYPYVTTNFLVMAKFDCKPNISLGDFQCCSNANVIMGIAVTEWQSDPIFWFGLVFVVESFKQ